MGMGFVWRDGCVCPECLLYRGAAGYTKSPTRTFAGTYTEKTFNCQFMPVITFGRSGVVGFVLRGKIGVAWLWPRAWVRFCP